MTQKQLFAIIHSVFWLLYILLTLNYTLHEMPFLPAAGISIYYSVLLSIPFYINYFFFAHYLFKEKRYFIYGRLVFLLIMIPVMIVHYTPWRKFFVDEQAYNPNIDMVLTFIFFILLSNFLYGLEIWMKNSQRQIRLEKEKLQAELNFLKLQINPHFLFNTLNNIYSLAINQDIRSADMVAKLSHILRYLLYDCQENRVPLQKEVDLLKNYIDLYLIKIEEERHVDLYTEGLDGSHCIAPLILITFLENCFKHGNIQGNASAWIKIELIVSNNQCVFTASNTYDVSIQPAVHKGIGLQNAKQQLALNYPDQHQLKTEQTDTTFTVKLTLNLNNAHDLSLSHH